MKAKDVLLAMQAKYAGMRSYQDRGMVLTTFPDALHANETSFATYFRRPNYFRFEWTIHHPYEGLRHIRTHRVLWSIKKGVFLYSSRTDSTEQKKSISLAIAGATGVSSGSAQRVLSLLMPETGGYALPLSQKLTLTDGVCEGVPCHCIRGCNSNGDAYELLVGVQDLLLRRISSFDSGGVASEQTRRDIRVNQKIDKLMFDLPHVPKQGKHT